MDLAGSQYDEDDGYQNNPLDDYPKTDNGLGQTLRSESEGLNRLVDESFEAFSHDWRGDSTDMEADRTLDELGEEQKDSACQFNRSYQPRRLLHITRDGKFTLEEFDTSRDDMPPYAVLSSASEDGDVVYRDLKSLDRQQNIHTIKGTGWEKIRFCAKQTEHGGPNYFWIETCCVNRANGSEVYDCINARLKRLENAQTCYVLLPDVLNRSLEGDGESTFKKSIWFTQCWTFLDLVVPPSVKFFSKDGTRLGDRISLLNVIQEAIGLPSKTSSVDDLSLFNDLSSSDLEVLTLSSHRKRICKRNSVYCKYGKFGCSKVTLFDEDKDRAWKQLQNVIQDKKRRGKIYRWLSAPDPSTNYRKARKLRAPGTGLWFLDSAEYKGWRDRVGSSRLWIRGTEGSGKTILSSTVIEDLKQHCHKNANMVTAYFYFDTYDDQKRDARPMLRALLHQLLQNLSTIPDDVEASFTAHQPELAASRRSVGVLLEILKHLMSYFTRIYIVLDALDGCPKRREVLLIALQQIMDWRFDNMHILVTSRKDLEFFKPLGRYFNAREVVSTEDIKLDLQRLCHDERLAKWKDDIALMQEIQTSLAYVADGRVYKAEFQLTVLGMCLTRAELHESLATLVQNTDNQYDHILHLTTQGIAPHLQRILKWLAFSVQPLITNDMGEIIALDLGEYPNVDDSTVLIRASINYALVQLGILIFDQQDNLTLRERSYRFLEHCSIRQYLFSDRIKQGPAYQYSLEEEDCHKTIAKDCLQYLLQLQQPLADGTLKISPLAAYAASHWTWHFEMAGDTKEDLIPLAMRIFSRENAIFPTWISLYDPEGQLTGPALESSPGGIAAPLYYAARLGLSTITTLLLQEGADVNERSGRYGSALQAAAQRGHLHVVKILLNNGADVSAQGGIFESAIEAAREYGHRSIVDFILAFTKAAAGSSIAPSDSGYASQRQADSLMSPSIPDPAIQRDYLAENQSTNQVLGYCNEETNPDDIRSIQSDNESIGSKISMTRSTAELFAVKHLATFFAQLEDLCLLHEMTLRKIERRRFIPNYRRILKSYYKRLLKEAERETEKAVTRVLRSRRNREIIAEGIADQLELDEESEQPSLEKVAAQPAEKQYLEDWLRRMQGTDYEKPAVANQEPLINDFRVEDSGSDSGFDTESEVDTDDEFANIDEAERFLQQGLAFRNLMLDIRLLMLPHHLRQIVETTPKTSLQLIANSNTSWVNNAKAFLESYTGYRWDWWPLAPRVPDLGVGEQHLEWKLSKRKLYTKITPEQAENLCGILDLAVGHPPNCHCCVARHSAEWFMVLKDIFWTAVRSLQSNRQRSAVSGSTSSKAAMAYTPSPNNTSGASSSTTTLNTRGSNASGVPSNSNSNNGAGNNLQTQRRTPTVPALNVPKAPTRVIFGVQGMRRSLEIEQIEICNQMNDQRFFQELNSRYKKHRWSLQRLLSPFRFQYCNFVKFEKLNVNRIFSFGEGLPDPNGFADDYDYNPKPPQGKIPLIQPDLFAVCLQSCEDDCKWSLLGPWLHDCFQLPPLCDKITCIPKKKSEFPVQCKQILRDTAWGIEAEYTLSFWMLCVYHLIPLLSSFGFWIYWLTRSPGDWQNASVPTVTTIALFAFVWVPFGFVFNTHRPVRYR